MIDDKFVVFKREEFDNLLEESPECDWTQFILEDAIVIRRQDIFAAPALDAYANSIMAAVEVLKDQDLFSARDRDLLHEKIKRLQEVADYFHGQASLAWQVDRKLPD